MGYPILVKYGIAILPRLDMLTLDSFAGSKPTPPQKARDPASTVPVSKIGEEAIVVPDSEVLDKAVQRERKRKGNKVEPKRKSAECTVPDKPPPPKFGDACIPKSRKSEIATHEIYGVNAASNPQPKSRFGKVKPPVFHGTPAAKAPPPTSSGRKGRDPLPERVTIEGQGPR